MYHGPDHVPTEYRKQAADDTKQNAVLGFFQNRRCNCAMVILLINIWDPKVVATLPGFVYNLSCMWEYDRLAMMFDEHAASTSLHS